MKHANIVSLSMSYHQRRGATWQSIAAVVAVVAAVVVLIFYWLPIISRGPIGTIVGGTDVVTPTPTTQATR